MFNEPLRSNPNGFGYLNGQIYFQMSKGKKILFYSTLIIVGFYFLFSGLAKAKGFMAPLITAFILALVVLPLSQKMESKGIKRTYSSLLNVFMLFLISVGFMALISFQMKSFVDDWSQIKNTMEPKVEQFKSFVFQRTPLTKEDFEKYYNSNKSGGDSSNQGEQAFTFFSSAIGFLGTFLLTLIYIFFILNYRHRFKIFLLRLFPDEKQQDVREIIPKTARVAQQYLLGKLILMGILAVLYSIGLGISGVDNFILIGLIAALLTLIPYIGNIIGFALAMVFGYLTSGETGVLIGIILTFSIAQFFESYVLEPYLVGDKVDLHPFIVILVVIIGNTLWGVLGMILAIPIMAIITVILLNVSPLRPFGFLFSNEKIDDNSQA